MIVLIHTSKTMRPAATHATDSISTPLLVDKAVQLADYLKSLSDSDVEKVMHVSPKLAATTGELLQAWTTDTTSLRPAIDSYLGDIYSGLQVSGWTDEDRQYAQQHLRILSGLYGILRPLDGIHPYRFEMGYKTPGFTAPNPYAFWGESIVETLPAEDIIIDLTAVEYGKTVTKYVAAARIITPRFLTVSPKTGEPIFVVVHAKIARGAFAGWMIRNQIDDRAKLLTFDEIGYVYNESLSKPDVPVFVCQEFGGLGLSVRLT